MRRSRNQRLSGTPPFLRRTPHFDELPLAAACPVRVDADGSEAGPLVHGDRPAVEADDGERELLGREPAAGVLEPCLEEAFAETLSCPFWMKAEADFEHATSGVTSAKTTT